jgi:hypothetical protein
MCYASRVSAKAALIGIGTPLKSTGARPPYSGLFDVLIICAILRA